MYSNLWTDGLHLNDGGVRKYSAKMGKFIKYCWGDISSDRRNINKNQHSVKLSSVEVNAKYLTREKDILEALNKHFVSVGPNLADKLFLSQVTIVFRTSN